MERGLPGSVWNWIVQIAQEKGCLEVESCSPRVTLEAAFQRGGRDGEDEEAAWTISRAACGLTLMVWLLDCRGGGDEGGGRVREDS